MACRSAHAAPMRLVSQAIFAFYLSYTSELFWRSHCQTDTGLLSVGLGIGRSWLKQTNMKSVGTNGGGCEVRELVWEIYNIAEGCTIFHVRGRGQIAKGRGRTPPLRLPYR